MRSIIFVAFALACLSQIAAGLQCYVCDECNNEIATAVNCAQSNNACLLKEVVGGKLTGKIEKNCYTVYDVDALMDTCVTQTDGEGNDVMYCVCNSELCNGAERVGFGLLAALVGVLLYAFQ